MGSAPAGAAQIIAEGSCTLPNVTAEAPQESQASTTGKGSGARVLIVVLYMFVALACLVIPIIGWIFAVAILSALLARRATTTRSRAAWWAVSALGLAAVFVIALVWAVQAFAGVDPDDFRGGLTNTDEQLSQLEADLARFAEEGPSVADRLDWDTKSTGAAGPTVCTVVVFAGSGTSPAHE